MKRIIQVLASTLFVITVLTAYFAFDFAINSALAHSNSPHKRTLRENNHYGHNHPQEDLKIMRNRSISSTLPFNTRKSNRTIKHHNGTEQFGLNNERHARDLKQQQQLLRAKPGNFHKGKTGVKVNKPKKSIKDQQRSLSKMTTLSQKNDENHFDDKRPG